ncbi:MAG: type II secretion system protein [Phormidesmis sp.]
MKSIKLKEKYSQRGFTLLELAVVMAVVGILAAIAAPTWLRFLAEQRTTYVQGVLQQGIQQAQLKSQQNNRLWQFSVRKNGEVIEAATHPASISPNDAIWDTMNSAVGFDEETTLLKKDGIYYVRFDENGNVRGSRLGRLTVSSKQFPDIKRCVIVSTLIGATRTAKEQPTPDPDYKTKERFCY